MTDRYDVVIVGGGLVGASMACALDGSGLNVAMLEAFPLRETSPATYDDRTLALSNTSCEIFKEIGLWPGLGDGVTPIQRIEVSNRGQFGRTRISADELGMNELGHVVEARLIGQAVRERLPGCKDLTVLSPATLVDMVCSEETVELTIEYEETSACIETALVIGADGSQSRVRELAGFSTDVHDYHQTAIIANVTPERPHGHCAYERLTDTGPLAMLPHVGARCGMVWVARNDEADQLMALPDDEFLALLQQRFGWQLGRLRQLGKRSRYPLQLIHASEQVAARTVIIGNAAHTIHNVAAQGFNLGLRDVMALAQQLFSAGKDGRDPGNFDMLHQYQQSRADDQQAIIRLTETLIRGFSNPFLPVKWARSLGLVAMDSIPGLKQRFVRQAMGNRQLAGGGSG